MDPLTRAADEPFLRTILHDPGDVLPRLVYADWLADHGREAEEHLIRAGWPDPLDRRRRADRELVRGLEAHRHPHRPRRTVCVAAGRGQGWEGAFLGTWWWGPETWVVVEHGFVAGLGLTWRRFRADAAGWFARNPVRLVRLSRPYHTPEEEYGRHGWPLSPAVGWRRGMRPADESGGGGPFLPPCLYDRLDGYTPGQRDPAIRLYPDRHAAWWAYSLAAVALGRERAGLPPLPRPLTMPPSPAR